MLVPLLSLALAATVLAAQSPDEPGRELLRDPHFQRGFVIYDPAPGKHVVRGRAQPPGASGEPVWGLAQWHSRFSLAGAEPRLLPSSAVRFANEAKAVTLGPPGTEEADLALAVDARPEYPDGPRRQGQNWPHLLASQRLQDAPALTDLSALMYSVQARLLRSERFMETGYEANLHAAQFVTTITIQNLNRASAGYGDFLWLNLPIYDDRHPVTRPFVAPDQAHHKLIYAPSGDALTSGSLRDGGWVTFRADLLPLCRDALAEAWRRGFLPDSQELADYRPGGISVGWEVPGTFAVELQIRDLSLRAIPRE